MNNEVESNIDMANKDHIVLSCDTLGTTVPEARHNLQTSSLTKIEIEIECVNEKVSHYNNCEDSSEHIQSSEYVNYYDNEIYMLEQLKTEFLEDVLPQSDCSLNTQIHSENKDLLKFIAKAELNNENIEDRLSLNIKEEDDYNEYRFIVKTEGLEEQEDVKCKFYNNTLENVCSLLQSSNKNVKVEVTTPADNGITELHWCQYCGKVFDNYDDIFVHISNNHKDEKSKCVICEKQFESVGNLNSHILAFHKLDKPLGFVIENRVNCHVNVQHKDPLNDHSELSCSGKEDGEDESKNNETRNITTNDCGIMVECSYKKRVRSPIHLRKHQKIVHRSKVTKTNNGTFQCEFCKNFYKNKYNLNMHIERVHYDYGKQFECKCGQQFRSPIHLREHKYLRHRHLIPKKYNGTYQCDFCKNFYTNKYALNGHIERVHYVYRKRFDCCCGKKFRTPIHLRMHETNVHRYNDKNANNNKFHCDYCKYCFKRKTYLLAHIKKVHYDCGKVFDC